jgi:hypothetical protein
MRNSTLALAVLLVCLAAPLAPAAIPTKVTPASLSSGALKWLPFAAVAILAVMAVAVFVYMLSSIAASPNAKKWARVQIYEALLSIVLLMLFGSFAYMFYYNPQTAYRSLDLVPGAIPPGSSITECTGGSYSTIFTLSQCDLKNFTETSIQVANLLLWVPFVIGLLPGVSVGITPLDGILISIYTGTILPPTLSNIFSLGFKAFLTLMLLNQIQVLLLACAPFLLSFFLVLGLVSRTLGFTRSFGGAMIAMGLGLGLVYPLLISITYGFIDYQVSALAATFTAQAVMTMLLGLFGPVGVALGVAAAPVTIADLIVLLCYLVAGFTVIPFLNFMILDAFIVDFSKAFGERLDFMSLLSGLV